MTQIASTYAQALYELARDEGADVQILEQMSVLQQVFLEEPGFVRLLSAPNISKQERCGVLEESFRDRVHPHLLNFMKLLTEKGYARHFVDCCKAYRRHYNDDHGILTVHAVSAVALKENQRSRLSDKIAQITGKQIELICRTDPAVLGGIRLDYDGKRVDGTVRSRLDAVSDLLKNTVL